jgi:hypothetical protein
MSLDRRDFHKLSLAALSGLVAGTTGCNTGSAPPTAPSPTAVSPGTPADNAGATATAMTAEEQLMVDDKHVCRGLNTCKGLGRSKENECAGQGTCASIADHACGAASECKGQAGCGEKPGMNECKGQGGCHVPLMDEVWPKARAAFESAMKKSGKTVGPAPAKT